MKNRILLSIFFLTTLLLFAEATTIPRKSVDQLTSEAHRIVIAKVVTVKSFESDGIIRTRVELEVASALKGPATPRLTIVTDGGTIGEETLMVDGLPVFATGQRVILFLDEDLDQMCPVYGWEQGMLRIIREPSSGEDVVVDAEGNRVLGMTRNWEIVTDQEAQPRAGTLDILGGTIPTRRLQPARPEIAYPVNTARDFINHLSELLVSFPAGVIIPEPATTVRNPKAQSLMGGGLEPQYVISRYWANATCTIMFDPTEFPNNSAKYKAGKDAAFVWNNLAGSRFTYVENTNRSNHTAPNRDNINYITFGSTSGALGVTYSWFSGSRLLEMDIVFNSAVSWIYNSHPASCSKYSGSPYDFFNVASHEFGHGLGLGHENGVPTIMNKYYPGGWGGNWEHTMMADDRAGVRANYSSSTPAPLEFICTRWKRINTGFVGSVSNSPSTAAVGSTITVEYSVHTQGLPKDCKPLRLGFYLSVDETINQNDQLLGFTYFAPADTFTQGTFTSTIPIPSVTPGTYYLGWMIDDLGMYSETSETNNGTARCATISITSGSANFQRLMSLSSNPVDFGGSKVGIPAPSRDLIISNRSTSNQTLNGYVYLDCAETEFYINSGGGAFSLAPGQSRTVNLGFTPSQCGTRTATLYIDNDATNQTSPTTVDLTGVGSCIDVVFSSDEITFGEVDTGKTAIASYVITNKPGSIQTLSGTISLPNDGNGQYKIVAGGGGGTFQIPPGQSHTIDIEYRPDQCGGATGELVITHNATNEPSPKNIPIDGFGACRSLLVSPVSIDFGKIAKTDASPWQQVELSNDPGSNDTLNVTIPCAFTGTDGAHFEVDPTDCGAAELQPGDAKTINLRFVPAAVGTFNSSLDVVHDATTTIDNPFPITVTGEGIPKIAVINVVSNMNFGDVHVGRDTTLNLDITNTGNGPLNIHAMGVDGLNTGDFSYFPTDTFTVWQGETKSIAMTFTPSDMGTRDAVFRIASNDPATPEATVALTGNGLTAKMVLSTLALDFDSVAVTRDSSISFLIKNSGNINLDVTALRIYGADKSEFRVQPPGPFSVAPGDSQSVKVTFAPTSTGMKNARLEIQHLGGLPQNVSLTGFASAAPKPAISASSPSIDFGKAVVSSAVSRNLVLRNSGTGVLEITDIKLIGTHPEMYAVTPLPPFNLQPGDSLVLSITFTPSATGQLAAQLVIASNAGGDLNVSLQGEGIAPALALSSASLDFGDVLVNDQKTLPVVITNQGTAVLTISSIAISTVTATDFSYTFTLPHSIQAGASDSMFITFAPTAPGPHAATMTITSNVPGNATDTISLRGIGLARAPVISVSATALDFGNVPVDSTMIKFFTIQNTGNGDLVINAFSIGGSSNAFSIGESPPLTIGPSVSKNISVSFSPRNEGTHSATLTIKHNDAGTGPVDVLLTGFAVRPGELQASVVSIDFGPHKDRDPEVQRSFVITNSGSETLAITSQVIVGKDSGYFRLLRSLPSSIGGGERDTLLVAFLPHSPTGIKNAVLRIEYSGTNTGAIDIALRGEIITDPTSADNAKPVFFELRQNYPNPFRLKTTITFNVPQSTTTRLTIHDVFGRLVSTLIDEHMSAGEHSIRFQARGLAPGVYFYTLQAEGFSVTRKLLLTR